MTRSSLDARLDAHRRALSGCRVCAYDDPRVQPILSLARRPHVMLVGQAPGKVEMDDRRAFAGRAGKTLFQWLARAGVDESTVRDQVYIAAITRCYPGPSPSGRGDRVPSARERAACDDWLTSELRLIRPRLLIPVGRLAIERFVGSEPLEVLVGRVHTVTHEGGRSRAVPLPHPSGASGWMNAPENRSRLDRALVLLRRELAAAGVRGEGGS